jgi:hypothetical protein
VGIERREGKSIQLKNEIDYTYFDDIDGWPGNKLAL